MPSNDDPRRLLSVHLFQIIFQPHILSAPWFKVVLRAHRDEVNHPIVKAIPEHKHISLLKTLGFASLFRLVLAVFGSVGRVS